MGIFARCKRRRDVCGLGLCGYRGTSTAFKSGDKVTERWWHPSNLSYPTYSRLMDCSKAVVTLTGKRQGMFLIVEAPNMLTVGLAAQVIFALIPVIQVWRRKSNIRGCSCNAPPFVQM